MKKRVMLAMAIIMLLGSVKAMASADMEHAQGKWDAAEEDMMMNDPDTQYLAINAATKIEANMADLAGQSKKESEQIAMAELRNQMMELKESALSLESVVTINGSTFSAGQALARAEGVMKSLNTKFSEEKARILANDLSQAIKSIQAH